jgi:hypothetical protein
MRLSAATDLDVKRAAVVLSLNRPLTLGSSMIVALSQLPVSLGDVQQQLHFLRIGWDRKAQCPRT